jgi:threonine dehydrogenase-like Zn-dependent dehydrogenase
VDPVAGRRDRAVGSGAIALEDSTVDAVMEVTGGRGADSVIDAVASNVTLDTALSCVKPNGTVSVIGVHDLTPYPLPILISLLRSITLRLTTAPVHQTWAELVPLVASGGIRTDGIVTHRLGLEEAAEGYRLAASRSADCMKVAFTP